MQMLGSLGLSEVVSTGSEEVDEVEDMVLVLFCFEKVF
jgi:hypothetical protein